MWAICEHCNCSISDVQHLTVITDMVEAPFGLGKFPIQHIFCAECHTRHITGQAKTKMGNLP